MKNIVSPLKLSTCATLILLAMNGSASADGCSATCGSAGIGNRVWFDADKDGIQDEIEWHGVNNVKLSLTSCSSSTVLAEEWLNKDGYFAFDYLAAGSYKVTAQIPTGYVFTQPKAGNDNDVDSDITLINGSEGSTDCITINANESVFTVDIGLTKPVNDLGSIGDTVFNDLNRNGFQDGTEAGISGVTINLSDGWGNPIESAVTDASGQYAFQNLAIQDDTNSDIGCYETSVVVPTSGNFLNATITTDSSRWACLDNGQYDTAHDYGLYKAGTGGGGLASIGDFFWHDANGDGVQDSGETGIPKAAIYLYDSNFSYVTHERTDGNGKYTFTGLTQGCYWLDAVIPDSGTFSTANFTTDSWVQACVQSGEQKTTFDFGVNIPVVNILSSINGTVWNDIDADQTQNGSEVGISGAQVTILDQNGAVVGSVLSDASGHYSFPNLADGCYTVRTIRPLTGSFTSANFTTDATYSNICVQNGQVETRDFGLKEQGPAIHYCNTSRHLGGNVEVRDHALDAFYDYYELYGKTGDFLMDTRDFNGRSGHPRKAWHRHGFGKFIRDWAVNHLYSGAPQNHIYALNNVYSLIGVNADGTRSPQLTCRRQVVTPLALDLNQDGKIGTTGKSTARNADRSTLGTTVKFNMFGNNQPIEMEWFAGDGDGILIDNRDGLAATQMNGKRLFGDQGGQFANGYEQLALFDTNADGQLTGAELSGLSLWLDNGDAIVQTGELQSLASHQIASISTKMAMFNGLMRSVATTTTGQSIMTEDVWFGFVPVPVAAPILSPATQVSLSKLGLFSGILALLGLMGWQLRKRKNALMSHAVK